MRSLKLKEAGAHRAVELSTPQARWLIDQKIASVQPSYVPGTYDLQVENVAGIVAVDNLVIHIEPKLPIRSLLWMLAYSSTGIDWRPEEVALEGQTLTSAMMSLLCTLIEDATRQGLISGYWHAEESLPYLRGRIRTAEQFSRHHGMLYPLEVSFDEYSNNISENRILLSALIEAEMLVPHDDGAVQLLPRIRALLSRFIGVVPLHPGQPLPAHQGARLTASYQKALNLAGIFLNRRGIDTALGSIPARGFLLDMPQLFEDFVVKALQKQTSDFTVQGQLSTPFVSSDKGERRNIRPDIIVKHHHNIRFAMDTKYKQANPKLNDIYQLNAYADTLKLDDVTLIYGERAEPEMLTTQAGKRIHIRGIDLSAPPTEVLAQITDLLTQ